jgi:hypothetical protein
MARSGLMGRNKLAARRAPAELHGWVVEIDYSTAHQAANQALSPRLRVLSNVAGVEPLRAVLQRWLDAGVQDRGIHATLRRDHGFPDRAYRWSPGQLARRETPRWSI